LQLPAGLRQQREPSLDAARIDDGVLLDSNRRIARNIRSSELAELLRRAAVARDEAVHARAAFAIAVMRFVEDEHSPQTATEHERRREASRPASDDHDICARFDHVTE